MKTDDELFTLWTESGGVFSADPEDPEEQTAMMSRERLFAFLRTLLDVVSFLRDESLVSDQMLICEVKERNLESEFDGVEIYGYDQVEAVAMYYAMHRGEMTKVREFICKLAGKIA